MLGNRLGGLNGCHCRRSCKSPYHHQGGNHSWCVSHDRTSFRVL